MILLGWNVYGIIFSFFLLNEIYLSFFFFLGQMCNNEEGSEIRTFSILNQSKNLSFFSNFFIFVFFFSNKLGPDLIRIAGLSCYSNSKWSQELHKHFSTEFKKKIYYFHLVLKRFQNRFKVKVPRPLVSVIINNTLHY